MLPFSNSFFAVLYKQQDVQMNNFDRLGLKNDVPTRWNSTYYMLERILYLKSAIATTLLIRPSSGIEFTVQDWDLCEKLVNILAIFEEATKLLSGKDACISACIPIVTTILKSFEVPSDDKEVIGMKNTLKKAMEARFFDLETIDHFAIATLLDPRFKHHFFRSQEAFQAAKKQVFLELDSSILSQNETTPVMKTTSIKNTGFSSMMQNIIAQSLNTRSKNPTSKLAKEVLNKYLESPTSSCCLEFWKEYEEKTTLKAKLVLAKVAKRFLTPPPTSTEVERLFSTAGDILSNERNRLLPENMEKILFCRENISIVNLNY